MVIGSPPRRDKRNRGKSEKAKGKHHHRRKGQRGACKVPRAAAAPGAGQRDGLGQGQEGVGIMAEEADQMDRGEEGPPAGRSL